jgi:hypothetical protein
VQKDKVYWHKGQEEFRNFDPYGCGICDYYYYYLLTYLLTAVELSLGVRSPYTSTDKTKLE